MKRYFVYITLFVLVCLTGIYSCGILQNKSINLDNHTYSTGNLGMVGEATMRFRENKYFIFQADYPPVFSEGEFSWVGKDSILLRSYPKEVGSTGIYYEKNKGFHNNLSGIKIKVTKRKLYFINSIFYLKK